MEKEVKIDEDLYSRSLCTFGMETMKKLSVMKILIMGMRGLGIETAKNIILSGPGQVDIYDPCPVRTNDLGSNFYISESDVFKRNRDEASLEKLSKLNPYVKVSILKVEQKPDVNEFIKNFCEKIKEYNVVVITQLYPMLFVDQIDKTCRSLNIKLLYGICLGLVGYIFSDFGPAHVILDESGEEIPSYLIKSISKNAEGLVTIDNIQGTNNLIIGDGDIVTFKDVGGMEELNGKEFTIQYEDFQSFKIGDTSNFKEYTKGGIVTQVVKPKLKQYMEFCQRALLISDPYHPLMNSDATKFGRNELLYLTFTGIHDFYCANNCCLPQLNNMDQAKMILENVKQLYENAKKIKIPCYNNIQAFDEKVVLNVARWASANIQPICAFFGGILAQEIIKATGKYIPIDQWLIYDFFECVENIKDDADRTLKNCRYDDQIAIFGNEIQEKIQKCNIFQIGAGATGCEFLKNFAMMGFCTDENTKFTVTDNDNIEISNLNRQFLFRKDNVGHPKSVVAIKSIQEMNPSFKAEGKVTKVSKETEAIFNEEFWEKQNIIIYAVDSVEARKYIDKKVILYQKFAVDSGTLGTRANSQIIIPKKTWTYQDKAPISVPRSIPVCTLRHFPSLIQHCIEWSKDSFYGYFGNIINDVKEFFSDFKRFKESIRREGNYKAQLSKLNLLKMQIDAIAKRDISKMCEYGIKSYTENFDHNIQQLLITFPPDCKTKDGLEFWVGSKRIPHPIQFNPDDELCLTYVLKFVQILSHSLGIKLTKEELSPENIKKVCTGIKIPEFVKNKIKIDLDEDNNNNKKQIILKEKDSPEVQEAKKKVEEIMKELEQIKREDFDSKIINPEEFEKDHDENGHVDFIHAGAILRARNYGIDECDRNKTKQIAGKIIPTILTTTAAIAGIVSLQLYTMLQTNDIKYFRDCIMLLHENKYFFTIPHEPKKIRDTPPTDKDKPKKAIPEGWNVWDTIDINESKTVGELCEFLKTKYNVTVETLFIDDKTIYDSFLPGLKANTELKIEDAFEKSTGKKIDEKKTYLYINIVGIIPEAKIGEETFNNVAVRMPPVKYTFKIR